LFENNLYSSFLSLFNIQDHEEKDLSTKSKDKQHKAEETRKPKKRKNRSGWYLDFSVVTTTQRKNRPLVVVVLLLRRHPQDIKVSLEQLV
jgi:hypothetical protein